MLECLKATKAKLESMTAGEGTYSKIVNLDANNTMPCDITYELTEVDKDILYLEQGEEGLMKHLETIHPDFQAHVQAAVEKLSPVAFKNFISDRDGTVNNYCGRYLSSVQSIYNGVFLTKYAQKVTNACILTSAPMENGGLVDIACTPREGVWIYAGSKGRECRTKTFERKQDDVPADQQALLDVFNEKMQAKVKEPDFVKFSLIGSGLQLKFGNTTIARQDITKSVPEAESNAWLEFIRNLIAEVDTTGDNFRLEDTGLDVEVVLTVKGEGAGKDFDKGDGVKFLNNLLGWNVADSLNLICGDTGSDVPMVTKTIELAGKEKTYSVFVTKNEGLRKRVTEQTEGNTVLLDTPDELVVLLHELSKKC